MIILRPPIFKKAKRHSNKYARIIFRTKTGLTRLILRLTLDPHFIGYKLT